MTTFADQVASKGSDLSKTEHRVATYIVNHRHQVLVQSAMELAKAVGTSDATVIRTAKALGYNGLEDLRAVLAEEFNSQPTLSGRLSRTVLENSGSLEQALETTLAAQADAFAAMRRDLDVGLFTSVVQTLAEARSVAVFGLGPTAAIAEYFSTQLGRLGIATRPLTSTGFSLADELLQLKPNDVVLIMAYGRVYRELAVALDHAQGLGIRTILVTDHLEAELADRISICVTVPRGRAENFSLHSATLAFLEATLVGLATLTPTNAVASLDQLNRLRAELAGPQLTLIVPSRKKK